MSRHLCYLQGRDSGRMVESSEDPILLSSPDRGQLSSSQPGPSSTVDLSEDTPIPAPNVARRTPAPVDQPGNLLHMTPPGLMSQEHKGHEPVNTPEPEQESDDDGVVAIVGEHEYAGKLFMFARYKDRICRKVCANETCLEGLYFDT